MSEHYAIWGRFSERAKEAAAGATYDRADPADGFAPRTRDCECPLGIALRVDGVGGPELRSPSAVGVARALGVPDAVSEAFVFIGDWDGCRVPDLRAAIGLPATQG